MIEQFTMPRKLAHELLGALFNGPGLNPAGYEALKQDFAARLRASPAPESLFDRKLANLEERGYEVIGRILHKDGQYALFDSSCRWLTKPQYLRLMHEQDGSLFSTTTPPTTGA